MKQRGFIHVYVQCGLLAIVGAVLIGFFSGLLMMLLAPL